MYYRIAIDFNDLENKTTLLVPQSHNRIDPRGPVGWKECRKASRHYKQKGYAEKDDRIGSINAIEKPAHETCQDYRCAETDNDSKNNQLQSPKDGKLQHLGPSRSQSQSDPELVNSPAHRQIHDTVDPDEGHDDRNGREKAKELDGESAAAGGTAKNFIHRSNAVNGLLGIYGEDLSPHGTDETQRILSRHVRATP